MDRERWQRVDQLFVAALELPLEARQTFLAQECAGDDALLSEVASLLAHDRADDFLEAAATEVAQLLLDRQAKQSVSRRLGRFEIDGRLGAGGMGEVYRARDPLLGRAVALKWIPAHLRGDRERRRRLRREASAASALNHPNIVTVHEILEEEECDLLVTELIEGVSLRQRLQEGPLETSAALGIASQIASGLAAAHAAGIVHRDIKPENVMIRDDGLVKILDFGIAKDLRRESVGAAAEGCPESQYGTAEGTVLGTVAYMSPEQARGLSVDARTDVWSLGVVLYEMLTGRRPFDAESAADRLAKVLLGTVELPSSLRAGLPEGTDQLVQRALTRQLEDRWSGAAEFRKELDLLRRLPDLAQVPEAPGRAPSPTARTAERGRESRWPGRTAIVLGLAALVIIVGFWRLMPWGAKTVDSIAVLPLANATADVGLDYLCDGLTESLIQGLAQDERLRVTSWTLAVRYKGLPITTTRDIGRKLDVRSVLMGTVEEQGDRLSVSVELVDTGNDAHLWGRRYDLGLAELATLYETISTDLLRHLNRTLSAEGRERLSRLHDTEAEAYRLYLEGRYYWYKSSPADYQRSRALFERALALDPGYALAWVGLGHYYAYAAATGLEDPAEFWPLAELALERGRALGPGLPELGPLDVSVTFYWQRRWSEGERQMRRVVDRFRDATLHYAAMLRSMGRRHDYEAYRDKALEESPGSVRVHASLGRQEYLNRRYDSSISFYRRALELDGDDLPSWEGLGDAYAAMGDTAEATAAWRRALTLRGHTDQAAELEGLLGGDGLEAATKVFGGAQLADLESRRGQGFYVPAYLLARESLRAARRGDAVGWMTRAFGERNRLVLDMLSDPVFDSLRDEAAYRLGVQSLGLPASG